MAEPCLKKWKRVPKQGKIRENRKGDAEMEEYLMTMERLERFLEALRREERAWGTVEKYRRALT